jgi:hypothetical protein
MGAHPLDERRMSGTQARAAARQAAARAATFGALMLAGLAGSGAATLESLQQCGADAACLVQLESAAVRGSAGAVQRDGAQLTLRFGLHPEARFLDQPPLTHRYLGRLDGVLLHVVRAAQPNQLPAYWLVSETAQLPLKVAALPVAAPGGRHFVVVSGNALSLYQRSGPRWSLQYRFDAPSGLSWAVKSWRADAAAVRLEWLWPEAPSACAGQAAQGTVQLRDGPFGWDLVPQPPHRC